MPGAGLSFYDENKKQYPTPKKFEFAQKGPYKINNLTVLTYKQRNHFSQKNKEMKYGGYYTINLPRKWTISILHYMVEFNTNWSSRKKLGSFLESYYLSRNASTHKSNLTIMEFNELKRILTAPARPYDSKQFMGLATKFKTFIELEENDLIEFIRAVDSNEPENSEIYKQRDSINFLISLIEASDLIFPLEISPDFNQNDPTSPLLCMVNLTVNSTIQLQKMLFGKNITLPLFLVGIISTKVFCKSLCDPESFNKQECRPMELAFPGIPRRATYHNFKVNAYLVFWHDFLVHGFRSGANFFKPLICYLIFFLKNLKKFKSSLWLWSLTDMDNDLSRIAPKRKRELSKLKSSIKTDEIVKIRRNIEKWNMIGISETFALINENENFICDALENSEKMDTMLAIIWDMHKNSEIWKILLGGQTPQDLFTLDNPNISLLCYNYPEFIRVFNKMGEIILKHPNHSVKLCILAYRFKKVDEQLVLLNFLQSYDLEHILKWYTNKGLYCVANKTKYNLENLRDDPFEIYRAIKLAYISQQFLNNNLMRSPYFIPYTLKSHSNNPFLCFNYSHASSSESKQDIKITPRCHL